VNILKKVEDTAKVTIND